MTLGITVILLNMVGGLWGLWCWHRQTVGNAFWVLIRGGQAVLIAQVTLGVVLLITGFRPGSDMHMLYALLAVGVYFVAEQLRAFSAEHVLSVRGLESAQAVGNLPSKDQQLIVATIVRREVIVMALAALTVAALALRAAATA
jgi:hypothetical protein